MLRVSLLLEKQMQYVNELPTDDRSIRLMDLAPEDMALVVRTYQAVQGLYDMWRGMEGLVDYNLLREKLMQFTNREFISAVHAMGLATYARKEPTQSLRNLIHDIRGGRLASLVLYATLADKQPDEMRYINQAISFARDHAEVMSRLIPDLTLMKPPL